MEEREPRLLTSSEAANLFGITAAYIGRLTDDGVLAPVKVKGIRGRAYPQEDTVRRYVTHLRDKLAKRSNVNEAKSEADLAKRELEIRRLETQIELEEGRAHSTDDVRRVWNDIIGSFKVRLWDIPQSAADRLTGAEDRDAMADILRDEISGVCALLAEYDPAAFYAKHRDYEEAEANDEPARK